MIRLLAESDSYKITLEYEYVTLHFKKQKLIKIKSLNSGATVFYYERASVKITKR